MMNSMDFPRWDGFVRLEIDRHFERECKKSTNRMFKVWLDQIVWEDDLKDLTLESLKNKKVCIDWESHANFLWMLLDDAATAGDVAKGDNAWYNEKTKKKESVDKGIIFWSLPNVLIIDLKRYSNITNNIRKKHVQVLAPINDADFSPFVQGYKRESYIYDLYVICNHG